MTALAAGAEPRHLVAVWNPAVADDTVGAHARRLLALAERHRAGALDHEDDVYVWWGKIRSPNRLQPLPHLADILALDDALREGADGRETHLYLTDYRSLYVAHVGEVSAEDPRDDGEADEHLPPLYGPDVHCDCWFRLFDLRRVVADDTTSVDAELRKLRNARYGARPVSIYGGMVDLPLLATRPDGARWFDRAARDRLTDGRYWVEFDAALGGVGEVSASLRDDVLGAATWAALDPAARLFVATAERIWRQHRGDAAFDFSPVVVNLAKAYEVQLGLALGAVRARLPRGTGLVNLDGRTVSLVDGGLPGLGALAKALGEDRALGDALRRLFAHGRWAAESLPAVAGELAALRNAAAHDARTDREAARRLRDAQLGVGCAGALVELARVRPLAHATA